MFTIASSLSFLLLLLEILPNVREVTPMNKHIMTSNFRIKSGMCRWSISKNNQCVSIALTILEDKLFSYYVIIEMNQKKKYIYIY
jgi:hypothetical protein